MLQSSRGYDTVLQTDCTPSIGFEGREAYPRVHRDNKSKYCATPLRLNPRHYRHQSRVRRLDLSPYAGPRSEICHRVGKGGHFGGWGNPLYRRVRVTVGEHQD